MVQCKPKGKIIPTGIVRNEIWQFLPVFDVIQAILNVEI